METYCCVDNPAHHSAGALVLAVQAGPFDLRDMSEPRIRAARQLGGV